MTELVLLPYINKKRYIYAIDLENRSFGILKIRQWNCKLKNIIPRGKASKLPIIKGNILHVNGGFSLLSSRYKIRYITASGLKRKVEKEFNYAIFEEPRKRKAKEAFYLLKDANKQLHNYYIITSKAVYAQGYEPSSLTVQRFLILRYTVVMLP